MRTPFLIAACFVGAITTDVLLALLNPDRLLPTQLCADIGEWGMTASLFLIPAAFVFTPAKSAGKRNWALRIPFAMIVSWYATLEFRMQFNLPALRTLAYERDDYMFDGVGMNAVLFLMGWLPPLVVTLIMFVVLQCVLAVSRSRAVNAEDDSDTSSSIAPENAT